MKCPKCNTESLSQFSVQKVEVDRCSTCHGIWFDAQELRHLLSEEAAHVASLRERSINDHIDGRKGCCPRDAAALLRVYSSLDRSVILDACPQCHGIWLDAGEFTKLFAARHA